MKSVSEDFAIFERLKVVEHEAGRLLVPQSILDGFAEQLICLTVKYLFASTARSLLGP